MSQANTEDTHTQRVRLPCSTNLKSKTKTNTQTNTKTETNKGKTNDTYDVIYF